MEKIASDLKMSELKQVSLFKAYEALHSEASTLLLLTVQWKDLDDHFTTTRKSLQEKLEELLVRERSVEAREKELGEKDSRLNSEIGLKSKRLAEIERAIEGRGKEFGLLSLSIQERRRELEIAARQSEAARELAAEREKEVDYLKEEIKDRAKKLEVLERSVRQRSEEVESKGKELGSVRGMLKKCRDDLDSKERQIQSIQRSLEDQRKEFVLREDQIKMKEERLHAIEDSIAECNIDLELKEKELDLIQQDFELKKRNFVSLKKSVDQFACEFDAKERKFEGLITALGVKEVSAEAEIEELGLTYNKVDESLKEVELKKKNLASLQRLLEERFHELEKRERQFEGTRKEFDLIRNTLAFRAIAKTNALDSRVKIEPSDSDQNCDDFLSFASYQYCITNGHFLQVLLSEQLKKQDSLCTDIFTVLQRSPNPAKLVLDAVQGFYPLHYRKENTSLDLGIVRSGCILLLEQLSKASPEVSPQVREEAMKLAGDWKAKMTVKAENFLEVLGFVRLLASYGLASAFDADELRSLLDVIGSSRQASELRQTLCIADKAPVDTYQAENLRSNVNIASSSPNLHSSTIQIGRNLELVQHEDSIGKSLMQDDILATLQMPDPAKNALGIVEGSFRQLWKRGDVGFETSFMKSYIFMFQQLMRNSPQIQPHVREDAMKLAKEWRARIRGSTENYLEVLVFLQFLGVYGLVSSFSGDDILNYMEMISRNKHALELSGTLGFAYDISEFVEDFLRRKRIIEAVRLALAFKLTDKFSPTKLLTTYMEEAKSYTKQICERQNSTSEEKDEATDREIAALRAVVQCVKDYNMEFRFRPEGILKRIAILEKIKKDRRDCAVFFASSDEQPQQQESCNKRRKSSISPLEQPVQSKKFCHRKALSTTKFSDLQASKPASQQINSSPEYHGTALAACERNVLGFSSGVSPVVVHKRPALPE